VLRATSNQWHGRLWRLWRACARSAESKHAERPRGRCVGYGLVTPCGAGGGGGGRRDVDPCRGPEPDPPHDRGPRRLVHLQTGVSPQLQHADWCISRQVCHPSCSMVHAAVGMLHNAPGASPDRPLPPPSLPAAARPPGSVHVRWHRCSSPNRPNRFVHVPRTGL
jgi:hypothetical protein